MTTEVEEPEFVVSAKEAVLNFLDEKDNPDIELNVLWKLGGVDDSWRVFVSTGAGVQPRYLVEHLHGETNVTAVHDEPMQEADTTEE